MNILSRVSGQTWHGLRRAPAPDDNDNNDNSDNEYSNDNDNDNNNDNNDNNDNSNNNNNNKVNRCLARYSPRATTTNRPINRALNKPGPN